MFGLEAFYFNHKTHDLEPMSSSSKSTPRALKKPFGAITEIVALDEEVFEIRNSEDERICLRYSKVSPLLEREDTMIKKTLVAVYARGLGALISTLNSLIKKFQDGNDNELTSLPNTPIKKDPNTSENLEASLIESEESCLGLTRGSKRQSVSVVSDDESEDDKHVETPKKRSRNLQGDGSEISNCKEGADTQENVAGTNDKEEDSIMSRIEEVIEKSRYKSINPDWCAVPDGIIVDRESVSRLKEALLSHPDKTQCLLGVVCVGDGEGNIQGGFKVYVNPELFLALRELKFEGTSFFKGNFFPAIVHELDYDDIVDEVTLGMFLNKNSKEFSEKIRDSMKYQDMVRFCIHTLSNQKHGSEAEVKAYLRLALKEFSKGRQNSALFLAFACLPESYLVKFEEFLQRFERGSLPGQPLSSRKLCNVDKKRKRKKSVKLEIPVTLLKAHMKVSQETRESLLDDILNKNISYTEYCERLKQTVEINDVKKNIETITKSKFSDVKEKQPDFFSDEALKEYVGAKITVDGENNKYTKLAKHVNVTLSPQEDGGGAASLNVSFSHSDNMNLYSLVAKMKSFKMVVLAMEDESIADGLYCLQEKVKDDSGSVGILINCKDENTVREELSLSFQDTSVIFEFIHVKRKIPIVENGFRRETESLVIIGDKSCFQDKAIKTLYGVPAKDALHSVIGEIVEQKDNILYVFSGEEMAFDIDPAGILSRKKVKIEYMSKKSVIDAFSDKLNRKVISK